MPSRNLLLALTAGMVAASLSIFAAHAQAPALTGQVSSAAEGPMEGVVVSAKRNGSMLTISVVSDNSGKFSFPPPRSSSQAAIRSPFAPSATTSMARRRRTSPPVAPPPPISSCGRRGTWRSSSPMRNGSQVFPAPTPRRRRCSTASVVTILTAS